MKCLSKVVKVALFGLPVVANASMMNLADVYQKAIAHNATYKAAKASYDANKDQIGVARSALLPQLAATGSITWTEHTNQKTAAVGATLTQQLVNVADWRTLSQNQAQAQMYAVKYAQEKQKLLYNVGLGYFTVLNDADQLKYAQSYVDLQKRTLEQAEAQYKVGVKAEKDVLSAKANYEAAKATYALDETTYYNDLQDLSKYIGSPVTSLAARKDGFPLIKPNPQNPVAWGNAAAKMNFDVQVQKMQTKMDKAAIGVAAAGFFPTVYVEADGTKNYIDQDTHTFDVKGEVDYSVFSSGQTVFTTAAADQTHKADMFTLMQDERDASSQAMQDYLSVLSDIEQIHAYKEAIVAAESAVKATYAGYKVGTETIVNLLQQQTNLFKNQGDYADALFNYTKDSIKLKFDSGTLTEKDLAGLNTWLTNKAVKIPKS